MNKDELFKKALKEFDEWPYDKPSMIYCHLGYNNYETGCFSHYWSRCFGELNTDNWQEVCTKQEFEEAKIMNNIMQAVNELRGDLVNTCGGYTDAGRFLTINPCGDYFIFNSESMVDDHDRLVCTTKEFNELVSQLETNFEQSITYTEYLKMKETKKQFTLSELNKIDGAFDRGNKYKCVTSSNDVYLVGTTYPCNGIGIVDEYDDGDNTSFCSNGGNRHLFEKVEEKHYWNGKEELEVGMWVQTSMGQHEILLPFDNSEVTAISNDNGDYLIAHKDAFKPIDTRTDKEKFIDEIAKKTGYNCRFSKMMFGLAYDEWLGDKQ